MRAGPLFVALSVVSSLALGACDDPTGIGSKPELVHDTVLIAAPTGANADLPTALDVTPVGFGGGIGGGRFPERVDDAQEFDVVLRLRNGELVFVPPKALGLTSRNLLRAGITQPITDRTFEEVEEAPPSGSFVTGEPVAVREGAVYVVRSRQTAGSGCTFFAKVAPVEVDRAQARVRLRVATSAFCGDERLAGD